MSRMQHWSTQIKVRVRTLMELINAGRVSMMLWADPEYRGSTNRCRVERYFRLSLASLADSVVSMSICFHLRSKVTVFIFAWSFITPFVYAERIPMTYRHSFRFSWSLMDDSCWVLVRQYSTSPLGPSSFPDCCSVSLSFSRESIKSPIWAHHSPTNSSK